MGESLDIVWNGAYPRGMNYPVRNGTTAAEGMVRRRFTVAELEQMVAAGILDEDERIELIGGEVVPMSPKGNHHEVLKTLLMRYWSAVCPNDLQFTPETTFRFSEDTYVEPDFVFYPKESGIPGLKPATALLVVEIADSSLAYDLGRKANVYAAFAIAEVWVINAVTFQTRIHRDPTPTGYRTILDLPPIERLEPSLVPALAVTLSELELH